MADEQLITAARDRTGIGERKDCFLQCPNASHAARLAGALDLIDHREPAWGIGGTHREVSQRNYDGAVTKPSSVTNFSNCFVTCALPTTERAIPREAKGKPHAIHSAKGRGSAHDCFGPRGL
jgi:hypothetical protein